MQREEKQFENSLEALTQRVHDLKNSISAFLLKLENEYEKLHWPSVLDSFALLSGQINSLNKLMKHDKMPPLKNYAVLPLLLLPDRDTELEKLTESRVFAFNHEVVPDYLRTKPEPDVEETQTLLNARAAGLSQDAAQKQINALNKFCANLAEHVQSVRDDWESEISQKQIPSKSSSNEDTKRLLSAIVHGTGIKKSASPAPGRQPTDHMPKQTNMHQRQGPSAPTPTIHMKTQSSIKTNIKSASSSHPYQRN